MTQAISVYISKAISGPDTLDADLNFEQHMEFEHYME